LTATQPAYAKYLTAESFIVFRHKPLHNTAMTKKKILIPLIVVVVLLATALGVYIASNQAARPSSDIYQNNR
jgi:hypothetical protein